MFAGAMLLAGLGWLNGWAQPAPDLATLRTRAEQADTEAQNALGNVYTNAQLGVPQDYAEALKWFRRAAEKGFAPAQYNLGLAYELGHGVAADDRQAFKYYLMAAEQGFPAAQFNVGNMYATGRGVGQDLFEANLWFKQAAEKGIVEAQFNLGLAYEAGRGVKKDDVQAARWYKQAADRGFARAQHNLGLLLEDGRGVAKNETAAAGLYRSAAEQGFAAAQNNYGIMLSEGRGGLAKDPVQAWVWLSLAVENGTNPAARDFVGKDFTPAQLVIAQQALAERKGGRVTAVAVANSVRPAAPVTSGPPPAAPAQPAATDGDSARLIEQLRAQSQRLSAQVQSLTADKEAAQREVAVLNVQVKDAQHDLAQARTAPAANPSRATPAVDASRYEGQIASLTAKLDQATRSLGELKAANQQLTEGNARLQQEKESLAVSATKPGAPAVDGGKYPVQEGDKSAIIANLQRDNTRLNDEVKRSTRELLALNTQLRGLRNQTGRPAAGTSADAEQLAQMTAKAEQAVQEAGRLQGENVRLTARVTELENQPRPAADNSLPGKLAAAQQAGAQLQQQIASLQTEKDRLNGRVKELESQPKPAVDASLPVKLAAAQQSASQLQQQVAALQTEKAELEKSTRSLEQTVNEKSVLAEGASANLAEMRQKLMQLQKQLDAGTTALSSQEQQVSKLTAENRTLAGRVTQAEQALSARASAKPDSTELDHLRAQLAEVQQQQTKLMQEKQVLSDQAAEERSDYIQAQARVAALERDLRDARKSAVKSSDLDDLQKQLADAQGQLVRLTQEKQSLASKVTEEQGNSAEARSRIAALERDLTNAREAAANPAGLADLQKQLAEVQQQQTKLTQDKQSLADKVAEEHRSYVQAQARVAALERDLREAQRSAGKSADMDDLKKQLTDANEALDKSSTTVAELTGANDRLEKDLASARQGSADTGTLRNELAKLRSEAAGMAALREENTRLVKTAGEAADLRAKNTQLIRDNEQVTAFMNGNRRDLDQAQARVGELEKQLADATTVRTRGSDDTRKLRTELAESNQAVEKLNATVAELTGTNDRLEKDLDNARKSTAAALAAQSQAVSAAQPDAYKMEISTLQGRVKDLESQIEDERGNSAKEVSTLAAQLQRTRETNKSLTEANRALMSAKQAEMPTVDKDEFDRLQAQVRDLTAAGNEVRRQNEKLTDDNERITTERDTLSQQLADARRTATTASGLSSEKTALQERLEAVGSQLIKTQQEVDTLQKENADATSQALASKQAADRALADLAALQGRATEAEKTADAHNTAVAELTDTNTKLETERNDLRRQLATLRADNTRLTQTTGSLEQLKAEADRSAQQNIDSLTAQLAQIRRDLQSARDANSRLVEGNVSQERDRATTLAQLRNENAALMARLSQAQGTLDQIASAARLGTPAAAIAAGGTPNRPVTAPAISTGALPEVRFHTVTEGDSLSRISMRYYGTPNRWQEIFQANRDVLQGSSALRVGMQLRIP